MLTHWELVLADPAATEAAGAALALYCQNITLVYLEGDLGAGKTTLVRGFLRAQGYLGKVKSPTYTLVETYLLPIRHVYHFDLYRLTDPEELEYLGLRDYLEQSSLCLVEWPERGADHLPAPDLRVRLDYYGAQRRLLLSAGSRAGAELITEVAAHGLPPNPFIQTPS